MKYEGDRIKGMNDECGVQSAECGMGNGKAGVFEVLCAKIEKTEPNS
jgi:hypothetical protein